MNTAATKATPAPAAPASREPTPPARKRMNVLKFNIAGHIPVNSKQTSTITKAIDAFNKVITELKAAGATITKDDEPDFTTVAADGSSDDE